jgi:hypothetical protein
MSNQILAAFTALSLTAAIAPVTGVRAAPAPSTLEQVVHANLRITHGGAIAGDSVPFPAFEHTNISAADILNRQELYHVNPRVVPAAPEYGIAKAGGKNLAQAAPDQAIGTHIAQSGHAHFAQRGPSEADAGASTQPTAPKSLTRIVNGISSTY